MRNFLLSYGILFVAAFADSFALFAIKRKFNELGDINLSSFSGFISYMLNFLQSPIMIVAILVYAIAPILSFYAFSKLDLSIGYPLLVALHIFFIIILSGLYLSESITVYKIISGILIIIAVILLYKKN